MLKKTSGMHRAFRSLAMTPPSGTRPRAEIVIVEVPAIANQALTHRAPIAEVNHVLCRKDNESFVDFATRVLSRIWTLRPTFEVLSMCYVFGAEEEGQSTLRTDLVQSLALLLGTGGSLTLIGCGNGADALFHLASSLVPIVRTGVTVTTLPLS